MIFESKVFKTLTVPSSFFTMSSLSIKVIFSVGVTLSGREGFIILQNLLLSVILFTSRLL